MAAFDILSREEQIRRLAFVQGWSDDLVARARLASFAKQGDLLEALSSAAEDMNLAALRDCSDKLSLRAVRAFGFDSVTSFQAFVGTHPPLSVEHGARPALPGTTGIVLAMSWTEVVLRTTEGPAFFERAWLPEAAIGQRVFITGHGFGHAEIEAYPTNSWQAEPTANYLRDRG